MIKITLPDGSTREYESSLSVYDVALSIGAGLARVTVAGFVDGKLVDATYHITNDVELKIVTTRDDEALDIIRHSCAHLLGQAVEEIYAGAKAVIGPVIENGFYYDFDMPQSLSNADLPKIEAKMKALAKQNLEIDYKVVTKEEAIDIFKKRGETYKVMLVEKIPDGEEIKVYAQGDFIDLCRGPHLPNTHLLKVFKLMRVSGAYWQGDSQNAMLQRVYGTCFLDKKELKEYLTMLAEAKKRDHRKIGKTLDLFHFQEDSPGIPFWHSNGVKIWREVEDYMRASNTKYGCEEIRTPLIADYSLWQKSGHAANYADNMFMTQSENHDFALRPMNCPTCLQVYNSSLHSYKDLPIRMAEFGVVHRNEPSGSLHGLLRVRSFTQDDGHVFCTEDQIKSEVELMVKQSFEVYKDYGFDDFNVKIALRPENRIGGEEIWDKAEEMLKRSLVQNNIEFELLPGEGAFYGPKIEFHLKDAIGRSWQCGTIQVDFSMPLRLGATYIDKDSSKRTPVMLHRAIVGSLERFIGMLLEHYAGALPTWLAPTQVAILNINSQQDNYSTEICKFLQNNQIRVKLDLRNEKIGFKIRENTLSKIPYFIILGKNEEQQGIVTVRKRNGDDLGSFTQDEFLKFIKEQINSKL